MELEIVEGTRVALRGVEVVELEIVDTGVGDG